ncbi:unnamed protein product [Ostreobium quekettii]|uniref:Uncharacterized protein n=1 Tax=Ostreobium quekettii TaxID=121088 RepID=A0A8S1ILP0_9CHLO|nr:unnamed protein product [Ostreobium quekettii]
MAVCGSVRRSAALYVWSLAIACVLPALPPWQLCRGSGAGVTSRRRLAWLAITVSLARRDRVGARNVAVLQRATTACVVTSHGVGLEPQWGVFGSWDRHCIVCGVRAA